jgi:prephenate dehydrogenase
MNKPGIGIIGFGDFSKLMISHLHPYADIVISTRQKSPDTDLNCRFVDSREALSRPVVIPSMPSQFLENYFTMNAKYLRPDSIVVDVCSVKVKPVEVLKRVIPDNIEILATHPLFGPTSASKTLAGQRIMVYPARLGKAKYEQIKGFMQDVLQLKVIESTPEEHDRTLAYVQGLSHYIGRIMDIMKIPDTELLTRAYADLLDMKRVQGGDSWELFESIMLENPYAKAVHDEFEDACRDLDRRLGLEH